MVDPAGTSVNVLQTDGGAALAEGHADGYTRRGTGSNGSPLVLRWIDRENEMAADAD
jgi:hypothetical protein